MVERFQNRNLRNKKISTVHEKLWNDKSQLAPLVTLVSIDCPWQKAPSILNHPTVLHLRRVFLAQQPVQANFSGTILFGNAVCRKEAAHTKSHSFFDFFSA